MIPRGKQPKQLVFQVQQNSGKTEEGQKALLELIELILRSDKVTHTVGQNADCLLFIG